MPFAAARDSLFPRIFAFENKRGTPATGIIISSILISFLMSMNFSKSLADTYMFIVLLSTLTCLVAYLFSTVSYVILESKLNGLKKVNVAKYSIALLAFVYSMWAVMGSGEEIVYWGFILLMIGLPFYAWMLISRK
jgi:APA family basic amino acid/polyamine antiporter